MTGRSILGVALVSAATLVFEIGLTRLFAVQQFHHFAFVVVSLATMGSAASGAALAARRSPPPLSLLAAGFAGSAIGAYLVLNFLPFDSYSLAWDARQAVLLVVYFFAAGTPFLFAGWAIGAGLAAAGAEAHGPYGASFVGSAAGSLAAVIVLEWVAPEGLVFLAAALALAAAAAFPVRRFLWVPVGAASLVALALAWRLPDFLELRLSPYRPLAAARLAPTARQTLTRYSAAARLDVVEYAGTHAYPGLSLNAPASLPAQAALFLDGDGPWPITPLGSDDPAAREIAAHMPSTIAYRLRPRPSSLILGPGAGLEALLALASGASDVSLPTDEPLVLSVLGDEYREFSRGLLGDPRITILPRSSRGALSAGGAFYDVIQVALSDAYRPVTSGAFSLTEDFLLTREAFTDALQRLGPRGLLVVTRWLQTPPSEDARAFATVLDALAAGGIHNPEAHLIAFRSMRTVTIVASVAPFSAGDLAAARLFMEANGFDPIVLPGLRQDELNRFNRIPVDEYHALYTALLDQFTQTIAAYDFRLQPPTDDRPFFFHFFRWSQTRRVLERLGSAWQPFGGSGYLVLLALGGLMLLLAIPLSILPLVLLRRKGAETPPSPLSPRLLSFFACLGAGYLLVEIPLIQRLTLLLDRPAPALAAVLFSLLLASGVGSLLSPRLPLHRTLAALVFVLLLTAALLPAATEAALPLPLGLRLVFAATLIAPAGFLMGVPFAAGLRLLERGRPGLVPWAWAVNGAASGVSGVLAALIALDWGQTATIVVGAAAYGIALASARPGLTGTRGP